MDLHFLETPTPNPESPYSRLSASPPPNNRPAKHVIFIVHGMGGLTEWRLDQLRKTYCQVLNEDFPDDPVDVEWIPVEWHTGLHGLETVDKRLDPCNLPTCGVLRRVNNQILSDVLFYFTKFHGQQIIEYVTSQLNKAYAGFMDRNPDFEGRIGIFAHSLGGIISYDILVNQRDNLPTQDSDKYSNGFETPKDPHSDINYPVLDFKPNFLFTLGSPVSAVIVMRGLSMESYTLPKYCRFMNIFHLYDPLGYRCEPLINKAFASVPPVAIQRPSSTRSLTFFSSYYKDLFSSYFGNVNLSTSAFPGLPPFAPLFSSLNKQISAMVESIGLHGFSGEKRKHEDDVEDSDVQYNVDSIMDGSSEEDTVEARAAAKNTIHNRRTRNQRGGGRGPGRRVKPTPLHQESNESPTKSSILPPKKRRKNAKSNQSDSNEMVEIKDDLPIKDVEMKEEKVEKKNDRTRIFRPIRKAARKHDIMHGEPTPAILTTSSTEETITESTAISPSSYYSTLTGTSVFQMAKNVLDVPKYVIQDVAKRFSGGASGEPAGDDPNISGKEKDGDTSMGEEADIGELGKRIDFFVQENILTTNIFYQYFVGLRSHFGYWSHKDVVWKILKMMEEGEEVEEEEDKSSL